MSSTCAYDNGNTATLSLLSLVTSCDDMFHIPRELVRIIVEYARSRRMIMAGGETFNDSAPLITISLVYQNNNNSDSTTGSNHLVPRAEEWFASTPSATCPGGAMTRHQVLQDPIRYGGACGTIGDYIYYAAGNGIDGTEKRPAVPHTSRYHHDTGELRNVANMITPRIWPIYSVVNDKFYVGSGHLAGTGDTELSVECYHPQIDTWTAIPSVKEDHYAGGAVTLNNRMIAFGGTSTKLSEAYDPRCDKVWQQLSRMQFGRYISARVAITDYSCLVLGGYESEGRYDAQCVLQYDSRNDRWFEHNINVTGHKASSSDNISIYPSVPVKSGSCTACMIDNVLIWIPGTSAGVESNVTTHSFAYYLPLHSATLVPSNPIWLPVPNSDHLVRRSGIVSTVVG